MHRFLAPPRRFNLQWRRHANVTHYFRWRKDFLSSWHESGLFSSQKEMRHLASQAYLTKEQFKNRSVDEGNEHATKSTVETDMLKPDKGAIGFRTGVDQKKPHPCQPADISGAQVCFITLVWLLLHSLLRWPAVPFSVNQLLRGTHVRTCVGWVWGAATAVDGGEQIWVAAGGCLQGKKGVLRWWYIEEQQLERPPSLANAKASKCQRRWIPSSPSPRYKPLYPFSAPPAPHEEQSQLGAFESLLEESEIRQETPSAEHAALPLKAVGSGTFLYPP